jgi:hypothetical protein
MEGVSDKIIIAFARRQGGMDIQLPIDMSVMETKPNGQRIHSPKAAMDFLQCSKELLDSMLASPSANAAPGKRR